MWSAFQYATDASFLIHISLSWHFTSLQLDKQQWINLRSYWVTVELTNQLTNFIRTSPLWNAKVHYPIHKSPRLKQYNRTKTGIFSFQHFRIVPLATSVSVKYSLPFEEFRSQFCVHFFSVRPVRFIFAYLIWHYLKSTNCTFGDPKVYCSLLLIMQLHEEWRV